MTTIKQGEDEPLEGKDDDKDDEKDDEKEEDDKDNTTMEEMKKK